MAVSMKSAVARSGLKASSAKVAPVAAPKAVNMMVWQPINNK